MEKTLKQIMDLLAVEVELQRQNLALMQELVSQMKESNRLLDLISCHTGNS